jgi:EAL domain-containing protein (putative c-di-GMP-specific phosphodiesterase class I)
MAALPEARHGGQTTSVDRSFTRRRLSGPVRAAIVATMLVVCWAAAFNFGTLLIGTHSFYFAVLLGAYWFGSLGAVVTGLAAGVLAGPLLPLDPATGAAQRETLWLGRALAFQVVGQLTAWFMERARTSSSLERSRRFVTDVNTRLLQEQARTVHREAMERIFGLIEDPGSIHIVFQPMVDLRTSEPVAMEALSRFTIEPRRGPDKWFEEAWAVGLGIDLELTSVNKATSLIERLPEGCLLAVNVSPDTVISEEFAELVSSLPIQRLVLELTEHSPIDEYQAVAEALKEFRSAGGRLAIDDTGAGYASFRHVLELYPDIIKLDIELTRRVESDPALRALTQSMVRLGFELNAMIVAEGVETPEQLSTLRDLGVQYAQGFYLSRPTDIRRIEDSEGDSVVGFPASRAG